MTVLRLRDLRRKKGDAYCEFAKRLHISESTLSRWELGVSEPNYQTLRELADYFGVSVDYIIGKTEDPRPFPCEDTRSIDERCGDPNNKFLFTIWRKSENLTDEQKEVILLFVEFLEANQKERKKEKEKTCV